MSEPTVYEEPEGNPPSKENTLKRAAKAFFAKARAAAKAVANKVAGFLNGHETTPAEAENHSVMRTIARVASGVFHAIATAVVIVAAIVVQVIVTVAAFIFAIAAVIILAVIVAVMSLYKVIQGLALALSSPYHLAQSTEAFKTNWELYLKSWRPTYFNCYRLQSVAYREYLKRKETEELVEAAQATIDAGLLPEAPEVVSIPDEVVFVDDTPLASVHSYQEHKDRKAAQDPEHPAGKGRPTPRQRKSRPSKPKANA